MSSDRSVDSLKKEDPKLSRSLSVNSLIRSDSLSKLFNKNKRKRLRDDDSDFDDIDTLTNESVAPSSKRSKLVSQVDDKFLANEKRLDDALPEEMRKFRPQGYSINLPPTDRPIRIYADGVFDLFHLGHMRQLEQCKKSFENVELVVGIPSDAVTHKLKGLTVLSDVQRYETLRHCKWVDEVIEDAPWILSLEFLRKHKIDYCAHDDLPYAAGGINDIYKTVKEAGMFLVTQRTEGISTSDIITKIIRDYDKYLMRNFARGATRKELNVSWLKKNELDLKKQINDFRSYWKRTNTTLNNASRDLYFEVREMLRGNQLKRAKKNGRSLTRGGIPKSLFSSSSSSVSTLETPADKFASRYNGNGLGVTRSKRSLIDNFKEWVNGTDSHSEFESQNDDDDDDAFDDYDTSDEYQNDDGKGESKDVSEEDDANDDSESEEYYEISPDPEQEHDENREEDKAEVKESPLPKTRSTRGTKV